MTAVEHLAATQRLLVALDFDGTLAPLVDDPMTTRATPRARAAVAALAALPDTTVAFVSGRTLDDLRIIAEHRDDDGILLAGSHGAEYWTPDGDPDDPTPDDPADLALRDRLRAAATEAVADIDGAWVEPKRFGFGVHSRLVDPARRSEVTARVDAIVAAEAPTWRRRTGHSIVEYAFRTEGKDAAVAHLRELTGATGVLFAGDDVTDEDALRSLGPDDLGIRVGSGPTAAGMRVPDIDGLADFLRTLADSRAAARE